MRDIREAGVIAIDGAERLYLPLFLLVRIVNRTASRGLLITSHKRRGVGATVDVRSNSHSFARKIAMLEGLESSWSEDAAREAQKLLDRHNGDCREALFDLCMRYEDDQINPQITGPRPDVN